MLADLQLQNFRCFESIGIEFSPGSIFLSAETGRGKRRSWKQLAFALKNAQARVFMMEEGTPSLLLIDDIFGELDPVRRDSLLQHLPADAQKLVTATTMQWRENGVEGPVSELKAGRLHRSM